MKRIIDKIAERELALDGRGHNGSKPIPNATIPRQIRRNISIPPLI